MSHLSKQRGFSTIELLIAFAIATIFLSGAALLAFGGQTAGLDVALTNGGMQRVVSQMRTAVASSTKNWNATMSSVTGFYNQTNAVTNISPCMKKITSNTTWTTEHARGQNIALSTYLGSADQAKAYGGGCNPFPSNVVWDNPASFGSIDVSGSDGTGVEVRTKGANKYAFVTQDPSPLNGDDFIVINVTNANSPSIISTPLNNFKGLNGIAIGGNYAYVLNNDNTTQLRVINITNPASPSEIVGAQRTLPNIVSTCSPAASPCLSGKTISYYNGRLYIGTPYIAFGTGIQNHEFHVYCVDDTVTSGCTPQTPVWLGSFNVNHNVNDIAVTRQTISGVPKTVAYLAVSATVAGEPELRSYDVTNPASISTLGTFNPSGTLYGRSINLSGDVAYFGRDRATGVTNKDFYVLSIANPNSLTELSSRKLGIANTKWVVGTSIQGHLAFVATNDSTTPLFIYNVANPSAITPISSCSFNFSQETRDITYHDDFVYTVNRSNDLLRILYDQPSVCPS